MKEFPKSYKGGTLTSSTDGSAVVSFHFSNTADAERWFNNLTGEAQLAWKMRIEWNQSGRAFFHVGCDKNSFGSGIMQQLEGTESGTVFKCLHCGKRGIYPTGGVGELRVDVIREAQLAADDKSIKSSSPEIPDNSFDYKEARDWSLLEATQESLREHMALVKELQGKLADNKAGGEVVGYANAGDIEQMRQHGGATLLWSDEHAADDDLVPLYTRPQPQAIPADYALVPVEPTPEMLYEIQENCHILPPRGKRIWAQMIAAAPNVK